MHGARISRVWVCGSVKEERVSKRAKIIVAVVVLVAIAGAAVFFGLRSSGSGPIIKTATVSTNNLGVTVSASGKVQAGRRADVIPAAVGTLAEVYVRDGGKVKAGQKLALMDTEPMELQVKQARAGLAQAISQLAAISLQAPSTADVAAAEANVTAANATYDSAKSAYEFTKSPPRPLRSNPTSVTAASNNLKQARAAVLTAKAQLTKVENGRKTSKAKAAAQAAVDQAHEALDVAENSLDKATLVAPFDGVVFFNATGTPGADGKTPMPAVGSAVAPQAAPFSVVDLNDSVFSAEVDEADVNRLKVGLTASVTLDSFPGKEFKTKIKRISPAAQPTPTGGTIFPVDLAMLDTGKNLLIGMKGDAVIEVSSIKHAITIPVEALFNENGTNFVYKVIADKLVKTDITVGATTDTEVEVLKGLASGDAVALSGPTQYTNGMSVRVKN